MKFLEARIPPVIVALFSALLIWYAYRAFPDQSYVFFGDLGTHRIVAFALFVVAFIISLLGVMAFQKAQTTVNPHSIEKASSLVDGGIYKYSRNPMYLGMLISLLAIVIYFPNPFGLIGPIFYVLYMTRFQIIPEERTLSSIFGSEYEMYKSTVPRWILG